MTDLAIIRGDDGTFELDLLDADGDPLDLTTATEISLTVGDLFTKTMTGGGIAIGDLDSGSGSDPLDGVIVVTIDARDTESLPARVATWDYAVRVTWSDGTVGTRYRGRFRVVPEPLPLA